MLALHETKQIQSKIPLRKHPGFLTFHDPLKTSIRRGENVLYSDPPDPLCFLISRPRPGKSENRGVDTKGKDK
jgi:hypothetical protein